MLIRQCRKKKAMIATDIGYRDVYEYPQRGFAHTRVSVIP